MEYPFEKIKQAEEFTADRYILGAVLDPGESYTLEEVRERIQAFKDKEVTE